MLNPFRKKRAEDNFSFRNLLCYNDTLWLAHNRKNYRQVFDLYELDYVYAEFSFLINNTSRRIGT